LAPQKRNGFCTSSGTRTDKSPYTSRNKRGRTAAFKRDFAHYTNLVGEGRRNGHTQSMSLLGVKRMAAPATAADIGGKRRDRSGIERGEIGDDRQHVLLFEV